MTFKNIISIFVVLTFVATILAASLPRQERSITSGNRRSSRNANNVSVCEHRTPCGWAVYKRLTRQIDYFMKNGCECPEGKKCVKSDDDISVTAWVYRCLISDSEQKQDKEDDGGESRR